jgi:hypothetical protein
MNLLRSLLNVALTVGFICFQAEQSDAFASPSLVVGRRNTGTPQVFDATFNPALTPSTASSTALFAEPPTKKTADPLGIQRGLYIIGVVMFVNVWIFSIPPEFRRAKICTEEQVIAFPNSGCMTSQTWASGIKECYANGGGVNFDFTIDKSVQPAWMGGDMPSQN